MIALERAREAESPNRSAEYLGVVLDEEGVAEWEHGRRAVFVRRGELRDLRYELGWRSERPLAQAIFAAALLGVGLYMFALFVSAFERHGQVHPLKIFVALGIVLPMLGGWALWSAFRRGHLLHARLVNGDRRKLLFEGSFDAAEFEAFVARARELGYSIESAKSHAATRPAP